jgi:hypothetical protein
MKSAERLRAAYEALKTVDPQATWEVAPQAPRYDGLTLQELEDHSLALLRDQEAIQATRRRIRKLIEQRLRKPAVHP